MSQHSIQIELEGLIKLLAQNLYANPDVFLREMIQNAHDAIVKRSTTREEVSEQSLPAPEIRVEADSDARTLTISDNGAGLTQEEIHTYLSTIGRSGTGELKRALEERNKAGAVDLIGQFGIGLLSAFIVADSIELTTRSMTDSGYKWTSSGSRWYSLEPIDRKSIGTTVVLHLGREHTRYLDREHLQKIIRTYANIIGIPIYLGKETYPSNDVDAPWHREYLTAADEDESYYLYWEKRFRGERALDVWPIRAKFMYQDEEKGHAREGEIRGFLGITDRRVPIEARGLVDIFISRMFIASSHGDVLPTWARFIQGVMECSQLTPNAARDDVIRNGCLNAVRQTLGRLILEHLTGLFRNDRKRFTEIMRWHSYQILAMCAQEEHKDFFMEVADIVPLKSDQGYITVPQYLERATTSPDEEKNVYYITEPGSSSQYYLLCEARGIRVFDATEVYAEAFLKRYASTWPERARLRRLDVTNSEVIFEPVEDEVIGNYELMIAQLRKLPGVVPKVSRFKPKEVPVLMTESQAAESRREMKALAEDVAMPDFIRDTIKKHLSEDNDPMTLNINADNPIIQRLVKRARQSDDIGWNALVSLYNNAVMLHSRNITPHNIRTMFGQYNQVVDSLLTEAEQREELGARCRTLEAQLAKAAPVEPKAAPLSRYVTCFVAMPFNSPEANALYKALEEVLEDEPFFWSVIRADEQVTDSRLWMNVEQQMISCHCFAAEVSDHNPNVMIEIGRMEVLRRPLLLIKRRGAKDLPADISERLFVEYEGEGVTLVNSLREQILKQQQFCQQRGEKFLSEILLRKIEGLGGRIPEQIAKEFETCNDFLAADPVQLARRLNVNQYLAQAAQEGLKEILSRQGSAL